jgi:large subunit ribosomal protein L32
MVPLPKKKCSRARQGERRAHLGLQAASLIDCPQCHSPKLPHHVCPTCGTYDGRQVVEIESPKKKTNE